MHLDVESVSHLDRFAGGSEKGRTQAVFPQQGEGLVNTWHVSTVTLCQDGYLCNVLVELLVDGAKGVHDKLKSPSTVGLRLVGIPLGAVLGSSLHRVSGFAGAEGRVHGVGKNKVSCIILFPILFRCLIGLGEDDVRVRVRVRVELALGGVSKTGTAAS